MEYIGFVKDARFGPWGPEWVLWHNLIAISTLGKCTAVPCRLVPNTGMVMRYNYPRDEEHAYRLLG